MLTLIVGRILMRILSRYIVLLYIDITHESFLLDDLVESIDPVVVILQAIELFLQEHHISVVLIKL